MSAAPLTPKELVWEGPDLYEYADSGANKYPTRCICHIKHVPSKTPFGGHYRINFNWSVQGQYHFEPYASVEEAKAVATALWRMQ